MTIDRLHNYRALLVEREQIKRLLAEVEERERELWSAATSLGGRGDGMPRAKNAGHPDSKLVSYIDERDKTAASRAALIARYKAKLEEIDAEQLAIEEAVDALPTREANMIRAKYLEAMRIEDICERYAFSRRQVFRILESAVELLARM